MPESPGPVQRLDLPLGPPRLAVDAEFDHSLVVNSLCPGYINS